MLYYQFNGYEGFKEIFGIQEHGNGAKSRRNKILLALMTCREFWKALRTAPFTRMDGEIIDEKTRRHCFLDEFYALKNMNDMRKTCILLMNTVKHMRGEYNCTINMEKDDVVYTFRSSVYEIDNGGVCFDGDTKAIRYINHESGGRIYKMKAGKLLRKLIDENYAGQFLPEQVKVWLCEDFAERWQAYAKRKVCLDDLHISDELDDFVRIYKCENYASDFGSCMSHDGGSHASFYVDAVQAKAAWLTNEEGLITARCVIFTNVKDEEDNNWRLAERQYSSGGDNVLKRLLVDKLIAAGEIDGYKQVGVDCHNAKAYVANDGTSLSDKRFRIDCNLESGDVLSYQDSFKWYDEDDHVAYNYKVVGAEQCLDETDLYYREPEDDHENDCWSECNQCYIFEDDAYYVETRDDYYYRHQVTEAYIMDVNGDWYEEWCDNDDVLEINGEYYYAGHDCEDPSENGIYLCPICGEYFVPGRYDSVYSDLTDSDYCCDDCREEAVEEYIKDNDCRYDEYDGEWYDTYAYTWVRVLVWDKEKHRRVNGYTRRYNLRFSSFVNYKGNWYLYHLTCKDDVVLPIEIAENLHEEKLAA